jgi:hypothetical protein
VSPELLIVFVADSLGLFLSAGIEHPPSGSRRARRFSRLASLVEKLADRRLDELFDGWFMILAMFQRLFAMADSTIAN